MSGATAATGRQAFVTATWLEWRKRLAPFVPSVARQLRACQMFGQVFDGNRRASMGYLEELAIGVERAG